MKKPSRSLAVIGLTLTLSLSLSGCADGGEDAAAPNPQAPAEEAPSLRELDPAAAKALFEAGSALPVDANSPATRQAEGVVPNAVLLSSGAYDLAELPEDAGTLVFYCANTYCSASDEAAEKARAAGREVAVMRAGISGWKEAGFETDSPS